ncbi:carbohydrate sulfotransferase 11-like [Liolophura sinensis]|uniref:carbohydrate sulfotransferase 11-like n=1 Tax=Liolophura sinensis TaxID=3198878 RepID=UPI003158F0B4
MHRQRHDTLLSACSDMDWLEYRGNSSEMSVRNHLVVDRRSKLIFCTIEKIGSTFWKRVLQITSGLRPQRSPYDIPADDAHGNALETFADLTFYEIMELASSYKKILFVRNPYYRLFSCYIDKFFLPNTAYFKLRVHVAKLFPTKYTEDGCAPFVTFNQFVKFVIHSVKTHKLIDGHFAPIYDHCKPCQLKYDIIGKMESFAADAQYTINSQNLSHLLNVNLMDDSNDSDTIIDKTKHLYQRRNEIEKCMPFSRAMKLFWRALQIRGVIAKEYDLPARFLSNESLGSKDMIESLLHSNRMAEAGKRRANRDEAVLEAYRTVSAEDLSEFKRLFRPDFEVFGYSRELNIMPARGESNKGFSFLRIE